MEASKLDKQLAIESTIMALRENLMGYFKGGCVEVLVKSDSIYFADGHSDRVNYNYQRRERENQRPQVLCLSGIPILSVQHVPDRVTFYDKVLTRSPELKEVYAGLREFMGNYLSAVEIKHSRKGVFYAH